MHYTFVWRPKRRQEVSPLPASQSLQMSRFFFKKKCKTRAHFAAHNSDVAGCTKTNAGASSKPGIWPRFGLLISRDDSAFLRRTDRKGFGFLCALNISDAGLFLCQGQGHLRAHLESVTQKAPAPRPPAHTLPPRTCSTLGLLAPHILQCRRVLVRLLLLCVHVHACGGKCLCLVLDVKPILQASLCEELLGLLTPSLRSFCCVVEQAGLRGLREGVVGES